MFTLSAIKLAIVVNIEWPAARLIACADGVQAITAADFIILLFNEFGVILVPALCAINISTYSGINIDNKIIENMWEASFNLSIQIVSFEFCRNEIYKNEDAIKLPFLFPVGKCD
ncbi:hypothetical protein T07_292 [Trichinella nelsoni]|uniref:Uncharacterized protein n=1 Tax=Trichinella nelsoni TaxID=6336 RepID=A0A0V0RTN1_9BILA|nr:hypothetical protein T07_292 [Trichinella nelsoni]